MTDGTTIEQGQIAYTDLIKKPLREFRLIDRRTGICPKCSTPVIAPRILARLHLDPSKLLIFRKRPPLPNFNSGRHPDTVWLLGWQQTLRDYMDLAGNPAVIYHLLVVNEHTGEVQALDRFVEDIGAGTHAPELYLSEIEAGLRGVFDSEGKLRPETGSLMTDEDRVRDVAGVEHADA